MSVQSPAPPQSQQQFINGITARLAQLAKDPPDLPIYLRAHAECISAAFKPVGFVYEMQNGAAFQRVLQANLDSLGYKQSPEQENSFQRAVRLAADQRKPLLLPPHSQKATGVQGMSVEDSPAPDELPLFNRTAFEQVFIPIPNGDTTAGVLHIWFPAGAGAASHTRMGLLRQVCSDIELYLKTRRARDVSQEITRLSTYLRLLEEMTGDIELESVGWNLVNYAREAVACERVCLFVASNYDRVMLPDAVVGDLEYEFHLQACSGLKKPHPKSEQALVLQRVAQKLTQMSINKALADAPDQPSPRLIPAADKNLVAANGAPNSPRVEAPKSPAPPPAAADPRRARPQLTLMMRDPSKTPTRPPEVNEYFDLMPMNWATVIPLFDRDQRICGILLFEGVKLEEKLANSLKPMLDLAVSAGRALGTTLYFSQHRSMRVARRMVTLRERYVNTPAKRKWLRFGLPILLLAGLLVLPVDYNIKGNASILAVRQNTLPALVGTRLLEVAVREGEEVKADQILARFDTHDIQLQLSQLDQEYERSLLESDAALNMGNEAQMQISRLNAAKAAAMAEKLRLDLSRAVVRAPFDGLVLGAQTLSTRVGEVLRVGEPALQVVDPTAWQVKAMLRERDLISLDRYLQENGPVTASLRLAANPTFKHELELDTPNQLAYGLDTGSGEYEFTAMLPLTTRLDDSTFLKSGFTGRVTFEAGKRSVAYILFHDFVDFLRVRFF